MFREDVLLEGKTQYLTPPATPPFEAITGRTSVICLDGSCPVSERRTCFEKNLSIYFPPQKDALPEGAEVFEKERESIVPRDKGGFLLRDFSCREIIQLKKIQQAVKDISGIKPATYLKENEVGVVISMFRSFSKRECSRCLKTEELFQSISPSTSKRERFMDFIKPDRCSVSFSKNVLLTDEIEKCLLEKKQQKHR